MPTLPQKAAADKPADRDWAAALQAEMLTVVRQAIEHRVGAELAAVLGPPYARGEARVGYRHGSKVRTITSPVGAVTLTVLRAGLQADAGVTEWQSQVLPAYARRMRQVNEAVLQAYLWGANTRRIRGALKPLLQGRALSKSAISRIVQGLKAQLEAWRTRTLADSRPRRPLPGWLSPVRPPGRAGQPSPGAGGPGRAAEWPEGPGAPVTPREREHGGVDGGLREPGRPECPRAAALRPRWQQATAATYRRTVLTFSPSCAAIRLWAVPLSHSRMTSLTSSIVTSR